MSPRLVKRRVREPDVKRGKLLRAAFQEMHRHGFQGASLDAILATAGVTKGAFYHHFPSKTELGYAVVDEVVAAAVLDDMIRPLDLRPSDPLTALQRALRRRAARETPASIALGCPLNNLAQEMSPLDEGFRRRVDRAFERWTAAYAEALTRGRARGTVRRGVDAKAVAEFVVGSLEGAIGRAKNARSIELLKSNVSILIRYLDTLRPG